MLPESQKVKFFACIVTDYAYLEECHMLDGLMSLKGPFYKGEGLCDFRATRPFAVQRRTLKENILAE